jgi:hypothetical protein
MEFEFPVTPSANASTTDVFPVPVGPRNRSDAIGLCGSFIPLINFSRQLVIAVVASSWPTIREANFDLRFWTFGLVFVISIVRIGVFLIQNSVELVYEMFGVRLLIEGAGDQVSIRRIARIDQKHRPPFAFEFAYFEHCVPPMRASTL